MGPTSSGEAFAAASAAMVRGVDSASTVHVLLGDCLELLGADSAGLLVRVGDQDLEMLAATSHEAEKLELYQSQARQGPCVESIESGTSRSASGAAALVERWPDFGRAMAQAGCQAVHAEPMRWHQRVLGGLNVFWSAPRTLTEAEQGLLRAFADISSLALMQTPTSARPAAIAEQVRTALQGRVVIERAKGVLAQSEGLDMGEAFARLLQTSRRTGRPLAEVAHDVLTEIVLDRLT